METSVASSSGAGGASGVRSSSVKPAMPDWRNCVSSAPVGVAGAFRATGMSVRTGVRRTGRTTGVDDDNRRYVQRVGDLIVAAASACSPFRGLPDEYYRTPQGGWSNINVNYSLPG